MESAKPTVTFPTAEHCHHCSFGGRYSFPVPRRENTELFTHLRTQRYVKPVGTGKMGDRSWLCRLTSHSGQLNLLPSAGRKASRLLAKKQRQCSAAAEVTVRTVGNFDDMTNAVTRPLSQVKEL